LSGTGVTPIGLWLTVVASGLYHGLNPAMGWPLAVSATMMEPSSRVLLAAMGYLAIGHLLAMLAMLLPFVLLATLLAWQREIQLGASLLVIGFGIVRFLCRRHPRALARISPTRLGLWSFVVAIAHGAGLMLVPIYLGLCRMQSLDKGQDALSQLIGMRLSMALIVSLVHAMAMIMAGGLLAWVALRYLGPRLVARSWFNLDAIWAASLVFVGALSFVITAAGS
jgi:hypothetical protein